MSAGGTSENPWKIFLNLTGLVNWLFLILLPFLLGFRDSFLGVFQGAQGGHTCVFFCFAEKENWASPAGYSFEFLWPDS